MQHERNVNPRIRLKKQQQQKQLEICVHMNIETKIILPFLHCVILK